MEALRLRLTAWIEQIRDAFWALPALLVVVGLVLGEALVVVEQHGLVSPWLLNGWLYGGGESGARTLLGAIAGSSIGVAGTVFSITIASLALASNQMGPRLLRNFTRDRGDQLTLGMFLGVFCYALLDLRAARGTNEGRFVPHLAVSVAVVLAVGCVAALVSFVHHASSRISVDVVIDLVHEGLCRTLDRLTEDVAAPRSHPDLEPMTARLADTRRGYVQSVNADALADWAEAHGAQLRLRLKPGDYVFPGRPVLAASRVGEGLDQLLLAGVSVGSRRTASHDMEFDVRQLVEVAVRALSPGINDPLTAISVLDRLGGALCRLKGRHLATGLTWRGDQVVVARNAVSYDDLTDAMFHLIRQNAAGTATVLIHCLEVLTAVCEVEDDPNRRGALRRHGDLVSADGLRDIPNPSDRADLETRWRVLLAVIE